jgi:hypothetical protein
VGVTRTNSWSLLKKPQIKLWKTAGKYQNVNIMHDGILSLGDFSMMIKIYFAWPKDKKCAPYLRGNMEFPIYY